MASILEFEAKKDSDYPKVARVLYNRLKDGMLLQLDSTVSYASGREGDVFTTPAERNSDSPYNTYKAPGLPPGPDRLARREDDQGGAQPGQRLLALLRRGQPRDRRDGVLQHQGRARPGGHEARAVLPRRGRQDLLMRCAVLGSPIAHSLSPAMHRAAYAELGLDWTYDAVEVEEDGLEPFLSALGDDVRGFSVTAPLKRRTAALVGEASEIVGRLGVANTILVEDSGPACRQHRRPGRRGRAARARRRDGSLGTHPRRRSDRGLDGIRRVDAGRRTRRVRRTRAVPRRRGSARWPRRRVSR